MEDVPKKYTAAAFLPEQPTDNVWLEITKTSHHHGGKGWEFGTCLWSPSKTTDGKDYYRGCATFGPEIW